MYIKDIALDLQVHPKTITRALKRGGAPAKRRCSRTGKLTGFTDRVDELLRSGIWNARVILRELQAVGFTGGYTLVTDYIRPKRVLRPSRATVRFETAPGHQLQNDWGEVLTQVGGIEQKVYFAVNTLGYSRRFHVWAALRQDAEHTYEGLIRSFEYFGGVPAEVLVDNQKSAVIEHKVSEAVRFNARFVDLAGYYGFVPKACRPYRARTKGKTERMVRYVKEHFFVRYREFESLMHLNQQLEQWLVEEADPRFHGTYKQRVIERFVQEQEVLMPLPRVRFDTAYREQRLVAWDGYIDVRGNRYSVPSSYCGQAVTVRIGLDAYLRVFNLDGHCIAEHRLCSAGRGWQTVAEHHRSLWRQSLHVERRDLQVYEEVGQWN